MKNFKFRAWDNGSKSMLNWDYLIGYCDLDFLFGDVKRDYVPDAVMQYIGMNDMNDTEIYEDDIVRVIADGVEYFYQVIFDEDELDFKATNGKEEYGSNFVYLKSCEEVEVIGNIYEVPEFYKTGDLKKAIFEKR